MSHQENLYNGSKDRGGSIGGREDDPPNPLPSQPGTNSRLGQPKKAWEWHYRSFLSRSSSNSQHHANSGGLATTIKASPKKLKNRFKSFGNRLHRRSATSSSDPISSSPTNATGESLHATSSLDATGFSSSWTGTYTPTTLPPSLVASYAGLSQQPPMSSSPPDSLRDLSSSPSSPFAFATDPYQKSRGVLGAASPPKFLSSSTPSYPTPYRTSQTGRFRSVSSSTGSSLLSSSLTMINESTNVSFSSTEELNAAVNSDEPLDMLRRFREQRQQQQQHPQEKVSNLSLLMTQYLTTEDTPQQENQQQQHTSVKQGSLLRQLFGKHKHGGATQSMMDASSHTADTLQSSNTSILRDQHHQHGSKLPSHKVSFMRGTLNSRGSGIVTTTDAPGKQYNEMDTSLRLGSVRRLEKMNRAVSTSALTSLEVPVEQQSDPHDDKTRKLVFTKFHNSTQFGKDSTSAYLGDDVSVHGAALASREGLWPGAESGRSILTVTTSAIGSSGETYAAELKRHHDVVVYSPERRVRQDLISEYVSSDAMSPKSLVHGQGDVSPVVSVYKSTLGVSGGTEGSNGNALLSGTNENDRLRMVSPPVDHETEALQHPTLNDLPYHHVDSPLSFLRRYTEDETNCRSLVGPMVLMTCASIGSPPILPFGLDDESSMRPTGMLALGAAKVANSFPVSSHVEPIGSESRFFDDAQKHTSPWFPYQLRSFALYHNYLLEYHYTSHEGRAHLRNTRPVGYAHLESASIRRVNATNAYEAARETPEGHAKSEFLEIEFDDNVVPKVLTGSPVNTSRRKVYLLIDSSDELDRWVRLIQTASKLTMDALYNICSLSPSADSRGNGEIGRGRYSTIYSAIKRSPASWETGKESQIIYPTHNTHRALKFVSKDQFLYRVNRQRERADTLLREVAVQSLLSRHIASSFSEPYKVPILQSLGIFETRAHLVLEMELLGGDDLFNYISATSQRNGLEGGGLEESEARVIVRNIFEALMVLKQMGIVHRDVKPANLLMYSAKHGPSDRQTRVKLCDFGMATFVGHDGLVRGRCGTPGYVAPEILSSGLQSGYPNKVDTFSAGVTLYVMLCGYEPFYGENDEQLIAANKEAKVEFPESDWRSVSDHAKDLICKLMEPNFTNRIDVDDVLRHPWFHEYNSIGSLETAELAGIPGNESSLSISENYTGCVIS